MSKKKNKINLELWNEQEKEKSRRQESIEEQRYFLYGAANRKYIQHWPDYNDIEALGFEAVAHKVKLAYRLLEEAYYDFETQLNEVEDGV